MDGKTPDKFAQAINILILICVGALVLISFLLGNSWSSHGSNFSEYLDVQVLAALVGSATATIGALFVAWLSIAWDRRNRRKEQERVERTTRDEQFANSVVEIATLMGLAVRAIAANQRLMRAVYEEDPKETITMLARSALSLISTITKKGISPNTSYLLSKELNGKNLGEILGQMIVLQHEESEFSAILSVDAQPRYRTVCRYSVVHSQKALRGLCKELKLVYDSLEKDG